MLQEEAAEEALRSVRIAVTATFPGGLPAGMESLAADLDGSNTVAAEV